MQYANMKYIEKLTGYLEDIENCYKRNLRLQLSTIIPLWDSELHSIEITKKVALLDEKIDSSYVKKEVSHIGYIL